MSADANVNPPPACLGRLCEIDDLGHVGEVVAGKRDDVGAPAVEHPEVSRVVLDLQIDQLNQVAGAPRRRGHELETERLEPQKDLGIKQRAGMDTE